MGKTNEHITGFDANRQDTKCWADCSCGKRGPVLNGSTTDPTNLREMDKWAETHLKQNGY